MMDIKKSRRQRRDRGMVFIVIMNLILIASYNSTAQVKIISSDSVPLDPDIRYGHLENGFTYYIKTLPGTLDGVKMKLIHKIGSNDEKEDEGDFAHAIEHLAFKSTKNFPLGVENNKRFKASGQDNYEIDASSGRRQTSYIFNISSGSLDSQKLAFLWFKDIVGNLEFTKEDIESVRGEVREEFLGKTGTRLNASVANSKMYSRVLPCENSEEGLLDHYNYFSPNKVQRFYHTWYQPRFFALLIVGNIEDLDYLESQIHSAFSDLASIDPLMEPKKCDSLYFSSAPQFVVVKRQKNPKKFIEDKTAEIHLIFRIREVQQWMKTGEFQQFLYFKMLIEILSDRLFESTKEYGIDRGLLFNLYDQERPSAMEILVSFNNGYGKETIEKISKVYHQLLKYGILESEFRQVKEKLLFNMSWLKEDQPEYWMQEIEKNIMREEVLPADKKENMLKSLKALKMKDFNIFIKNCLVKGPEDIGIIAPVGHEALLFSEKEVRYWITDAFNQAVEPLKKEAKKSLLSEEEVEGLDYLEYIDEGTDESGAREFLLNNGIKLVLFPAPSNDVVNQSPINLHGFRIGGAELLTEDDYWSALNAPAIVAHSGVNGLNKFEVNDILAKHQLLPGVVAPYVDYSEHGIFGRGSLDNLETMMQLVYLYFTRPNMNKLAFEDWNKEKVNGYLNFSADLYATDFKNTFREVTGDKFLQNTYNRKYLPAGTASYLSLEKTKYEKAFDIYRRYFGDAEGFTFLITGDFEIEQILPLARKYLGNLPDSKTLGKRSENKTNAFPKGPSYQEFLNKGNYSMPNVSYGTSFIIKVENNYDWKERLKIEVLGEVLRHKLWGLRSKKGYGLYGLSARGQFNYNLRRYEISTYMFCQPKDFERLQKETKQIFSEIIVGKISEEELFGALERVDLFNFSERAKRLGVKIIELYRHYRFNYPWVDLAKMREFTSQITREDLVEVARKHLKEENFHEIVIKDK